MGFRSCCWPGSVWAKNVFIRVSLGLTLFLFGLVSGPIFKGGFDFSEFNLIFWGLIIQEIEFLVEFLHVSQIFIQLGLLGSKIYYIELLPVLQKMTRFGSGF